MLNMILKNNCRLKDIPKGGFFLSGRYCYQLIRRRPWTIRRVIPVSDFRIEFGDVLIKADPTREVTAVEFNEKVLGAE